VGFEDAEHFVLVVGVAAKHTRPRLGHHPSNQPARETRLGADALHRRLEYEVDWSQDGTPQRVRVGQPDWVQSAREGRRDMAPPIRPAGGAAPRELRSSSDCRSALVRLLTIARTLRLVNEYRHVVVRSERSSRRQHWGPGPFRHRKAV
jgi:hypothetical protein